MRNPLGYYIDEDEHARLASKYKPAFERLRAKISKVVFWYMVFWFLFFGIGAFILYLVDFPEPINISFWGIP